LPPYDEPISIQYCDKLFDDIKDVKYFTKLDSNNPLVGEYVYCFSIGWPKLEHLIQAAIVGETDRLYTEWWRSERRDTRIIASALLYALENIEADTFNSPRPYRFNDAERKCRIDEMEFVRKNLDYFYNRFIPIFEKVLGKDHFLVDRLKSKFNLKSKSLNYNPEKELLIKDYEKMP